MSHEHHHHAHIVSNDTRKVYTICIALNLGFVVVEGSVGAISGSIGLISDAAHNLSDVLSLLMAMVAFRLSSTLAKGRFTFGFRKASVQISLVNALLLLGAVAIIVYGAIMKLLNPTPVDGSAISITAGIGIVVNGLTAWLLMRQNQEDVNNKGAFLHMLSDTLVSVGVVISGIVVNFTGWTMIDPIISLAIAVIILVGSINVLVESFNLSIDAVPSSYDLDNIKRLIEDADEDILEAEHIHIWPISTSETSLTAHVVVRDIAMSEKCVAAIKQTLDKAGIHHSTIETSTSHEVVDETRI